ncbi:hypothetical protein SCH01S_02_00140 [Sphingomonas changbaiensis NBRC 104936]|uniref:Filamentous haemagglutinin FhaB/tRNA nuclease CdiA-like TPS domain-containing protein n=1 Tax=Sphingomonas changbaiensis NBRC 104936 TaxID=1219043 RepID=A0A0E9MJP6_9SPHN|nr:hypothetical protein [Sphingomonas changbaiensis]GAO38017.1 hypothetical protein SCH01S_02_00140 [Sphingomonas changbaiensis NBRC 104936]
MIASMNPALLLRSRRARLLAGCAVAAAMATPAFGQQAFQATPNVVTGDATFSPGNVISGGLRDRVIANTPQVVIDWTPNDSGTGGGPITVLPAGNELVFQNNGDIGVGQYTVLNRVIPEDPSRAIRFDGTVQSQLDLGNGATTGGNIWFYSPGGIIAGATSRFDVGSLVLSANDIDISGGLFGDDSSSSQAGTIRFRGDVDSRSSVTIMPGAQINASGNYIALVAPRVTQAGSMNVEGGAALVAAESADITIPISGGLFDIAVQTGSNVNAGGETTLTHSGTTEVRDASQTGAARRVYLMAVPKNDAVTMLVSGSLGYAPAVQAQLAANGQIILTTGSGVSNDVAQSPSQGDIRIAGGDFGGQTVASAQSISVDTSASSLSFATDLQALANSGAITMTASAGRNITAGGDVLLSQDAAESSGASAISVTADGGSTIQAQSLSLVGRSDGANEAGYGAASAATGHALSLIASNGGIITAADFIDLNSSAYGGSGSSQPGANGTGGTVAVSALSGGQILSGGNFNIDASGTGGESGYGGVASAGDGHGGVVTLAASGGGLINTGQLTVFADGSGGYGSFNSGGNGTGGDVVLNLHGSELDASFLRISASGFGADGDSAAGAAQGGTISITNQASSSIFAGNGIDLSASARAGGAFNGGTVRDGTGGTVTIVNGASSFSTGEGTLTASADGTGGFSNVFSPTTGRGGTISITVNSADPNNVESSFFASGIDLSANGSVSRPLDLRASVPHGNSGIGVGGSVLLSLTGGPVSTGDINLSASGSGGNGSYDTAAGAGFGGRAELSINGGTLTAGTVSIIADAFGGDGAFGESGYGGAGAGGTAGVGTNPFGVGSGAYLTGIGGSLSADTVRLSAEATGGFGGDGQTFGSSPVDAASGGAATGGTAQVATGGVSFSVGELSVSAAATGGDGGTVDYSNFFGDVQTANAGHGGAATGGIAGIAVTGGTHSFGSVNAGANGTGGLAGLVLAAGEGSFDPAASGRGGNGGDGAGGNASIIFTNAVVNGQPELTAEATGNAQSGGSGAAGGNGGAATGGLALVRFDGGTADLFTINADSYANGGFGGPAARLDGGNGGGATGGAARFEASNGAVVNVADSGQFRPFVLDASAVSGGGGDGGSFADSGLGGKGGSAASAFGGTASVLVDGGAVATIPGLGGIENSPPVLIASARSGFGGSGGTGSAQGNSGGIGGNGGSASAGLATIGITGGQAIFGDLFTDASAQRGFGGSGGQGAPDSATGIVTTAASGSNGSGFGGRLELQVADGPAGQAGAFKAGNFSTDLTGGDVDGSLLIADTGINGQGGIHLGSLYAVSFSNAPNTTETSSDYDIQSSARAIEVDGDVNLTANGDVRFSFQGTGGLASGTSIDVLSLTRGISITNSSPANTLSASLSAPSLSLHTNNGDIDAQAGTLLASTGSIDIGAFGGRANVAKALATEAINITGFDGVTVGSLAAGNSETAGSIFIGAGAGEGFVPADAVVTGTVTSTGDISIYAGTDATVQSGAQVIADRGLTIATGDDIIIGSGALVRAANNPPPETGYGATDPLEQASQLRLMAGHINTGEPVDGNVASILIDGTVEAPNRTLFMSAGAVQASSTTALTAGNLYVRLNTIPVGDQVPSNDGGQLTGLCLEGSVCLGTTHVSGIVRIGESEFEPINLRLNGGIDGTDVLLRARSVDLGQAGVANLIRASDSLTVESLNENLTLNGPLTITGGSNVARVASFHSIDGAAAQVNAPGTLDLFAGNNVTLGGIDAATIRTVDFDDAVVNDSGITAPGTIAVGRIVSGSPLDLVAGKNIALDSFAATGRATLSATSGTINVATDASASGITATAQAVTLNGLDGLNVSATTATAGDLTLVTKAGALRLSDATASGAITLRSGGTVSFDKIAAAGALTIDAGGDVTSFYGGSGGSVSITTPGKLDVSLGLVANAGPMSISADAGIHAAELHTTGALSLLAANGAIQTDGATQASDVVAIGRSIGLVNDDGLGISKAVATDGGIGLSSGTGLLKLGSLSATGDISLQGQGSVTFDTIAAGGQLTIEPFATVTGGNATAARISVESNGAISAQAFTATAGDISLNARNGLSVGTVSSTGTATLKSGSGPLVVTNDLVVGDDLILAAPSLDITAQNGLKVLQADATAGDLKLTTVAGTLAVGTSTATGAITLASGGAVTANSLKSGSGVIDISGAQGVTVGTIASGGAVTLASGNGTITVSSDLTAAGPIQAMGQSVNLTAQGDLALTKAVASGGDLSLHGVNGGLALGDVSATGALTATTPGLIAVNGTVTGGTIALRSNDIAIGSTAQLGSKTQTTALTLTGTTDRMFIGDAPSGTGYRLDNTELGRIASQGDINFASAPTSATGTAFSFVDPAAANVVLGSLTFDGGQLGSNGTLLISSPRAIGIVGNLQFRNIGAGQTVTLRSASDIALAAESGLVTLKNPPGGLSGTLRLEAQQVQALSTKARTEITGLDLNAVKQRLGTNDQLENDGGYFQAGQIVVRIGRLAFIQNSGANGTDPNAKRGFTANSFRIETTGDQPAQLVLNGQVGTVTGAGLINAVNVSGSFDTGSSFNGCTPGTLCGVAPPPPGPPPETVAPVFSASRDQIEDDRKEDQKEQSLQTSQSRPTPLIQILSVPTSRFDPLIDQPVTGAGNEDLWLTPISPQQP